MLKQAKWIFADATGEVVDRYFDYYVSFQIEKMKETKLYISVYSEYAVYINGQFVNCGQYADYEDLKFYDTLCITDFLKEGHNELVVKQYVAGNDFSTSQKQIPGVIFSVVEGQELLVASGCHCMVREELRFASKAEFLTSQLAYNFEYDATILPAEFRPCVEIEKSKELLERPIKKLIIEPTVQGRIVAQGVFKEWDESASKAKRCQHAYLSACEREELLRENVSGETIEWEIPKEHSGDGVYLIYDMGGEVAGLLDFSVELSGGTEMLIAIGEHLEDLRVRSDIGARNFAFRYVATEGKNRFFYPFQRLGLRYIQVMIYSKSGSVDYFGIRPTNYPLAYKEITVQDGLHKMIWETGRKTLELCMHEHYEDCPWREQSQYGMDSRIQILCGYYAFHGYEFPKAALRMVLHSLREDKLLELCSPGKVEVNIPSFTTAYVREVLEYIQYSNDKSFAKETLPVLTEIVQGFESHIGENGLLPQYENLWNFYEWSAGLEGGRPGNSERYDCLLNAFVSDAFYCFSEIAKLAGSDLAEKYRTLHENLNKATHEFFWREEFGGYITCSEDNAPIHELVQAVMLYVGAVPKEKEGTVTNLIKSETLVPCTLSMTIYAYEGLLKVSPQNLEYVNAHIERVWSKMIRSNTDTFWETASGASDFWNAGSLCHGWSAVPIYIWGRYGEGRWYFKYKDNQTV